jgi:hypothetical protein
MIREQIHVGPCWCEHSKVQIGATHMSIVWFSPSATLDFLSGCWLSWLDINKLNLIVEMSDSSNYGPSGPEAEWKLRYIAAIAKLSLYIWQRTFRSQHYQDLSVSTLSMRSLSEHRICNARTRLRKPVSLLWFCRECVAYRHTSGCTAVS